MKLNFFFFFFEKYSNIKFHENSFIGSRVVPCGRTGRHEVTIVAFRPFRTRLEIAKEVKYTGEDFSLFNTTMWKDVGESVYILLLTSALDGRVLPASRPSCFTFVEITLRYPLDYWVCPRAGLCTLEGQKNLVNRIPFPRSVKRCPLHVN
jgi:hypothetical protein